MRGNLLFPVYSDFPSVLPGCHCMDPGGIPAKNDLSACVDLSGMR
jgi:hypothetical protein